MASDEDPVMEDRRTERCPRYFQESSSHFGDASSQDSSNLSARVSSHSTSGPLPVEEALEAWPADQADRAGCPLDTVPQGSAEAPGCPGLAQKPLPVRGLLCGAAAPDSDDSTDEEMRCAVCFMQMVHPVRLPCSHVFCFLCVKGVAMTSSPRCALCRHPIPPDFLLRPTLVMIPAPHRRSHPNFTSSASVRCLPACASETEPSFPGEAADAPAAEKVDFPVEEDSSELSSAACDSPSKSAPPAASKIAEEPSEESKSCPPGLGVNYQWFYEGRNGWWKYDERTNKEIEASYQAEESTCQVMVVGLVFVVDFTRMLQYRIKDPTKRRKIKRDVSSAPMKGIAGISVKRLDGVEEDGPDVGEGERVEEGAHIAELPSSVRDGVSSDSALRHSLPSDDHAADRLDPSVRSRLTTLTDVPNYQGDYMAQGSSQAAPSFRHDVLEEFHLPDDLSDDISLGSDPAVETIRHTLERFQLMRYPVCHRGEEDLHKCCRSVCSHHHSVVMPRTCYCQHQGSSVALQNETHDVPLGCPARSCDCPVACECTHNCAPSCECALNCPHPSDTSTASSSSLRGGHHCRCCQRSRGCSACCQHSSHCRLPDNVSSALARPGPGGYCHMVPPPQDGPSLAVAAHRVVPLHLDGHAVQPPGITSRVDGQSHAASHLDIQSHGVPLHPDSQSHGVPLHLDSQSHGVPLHLDSQSHGVSLHLDSQSHGVPLLLGSQSHGVSLHPDSQSHGVPLHLDSQLHGVPLHPGNESHGVSLHYHTQSHGVPLHPSAQSQLVPPHLISYTCLPHPVDQPHGVPPQGADGEAALALEGSVPADAGDPATPQFYASN